MKKIFSIIEKIWLGALILCTGGYIGSIISCKNLPTHAEGLDNGIRLITLWSKYESIRDNFLCAVLYFVALLIVTILVKWVVTAKD